MGNTRDTGYLRNLVAYDASGNIVLPANLTVTGSIVGYATTSYVTTQINNLINGAPGLLDTLDELAAALGDDANFASTITTSIAGKLSLTGGTLTGALSGTSATFSTEVTSSGGQGRFGGWATGAGYQGNALEVGVSGGNAFMIGYNRTSGSYIPLSIGGTTNQTTTIGGSSIVFQNNGVTALTIASTGAATFSSTVNTGSWISTPNNYGLTATNAAGTAGRILIKLNTSNQIEIGRDSDISAIRIGTASAIDALTITTGGNVGIGNTNPKFYLHSNDDITIPNNRYLNFTSEINAANFNKSLVVSYTDNSATSQPNQIGIILHNNSNTDNTFSPALVFGSKSASNVYSQATAAIAGKRLTLQQDPNWHSGELYFWTATSGASSINQGIPADAPAMILDSRRRMRVPSQPSFGASSSATIELTSTEVKLALDSETYDIGGVYDPSNRRFTAPVAGRYLFTFTASVMELGGGQYNAVYIKVNGGATGYRFRAPGNQTNSEWGGISGSAILNLAANDYVELFGYVASGYIRLVAGETIWGGYLLG